MNLEDFIANMAVIMMKRLKMSDWDAAALIKENRAAIERCYAEGDSPLDTVGRCVKIELDEHYVSPEDAFAIAGADPRRKLLLGKNHQEPGLIV